MANRGSLRDDGHGSGHPPRRGRPHDLPLIFDFKRETARLSRELACSNGMSTFPFTSSLGRGLKSVECDVPSQLPALLGIVVGRERLPRGLPGSSRR